MIPVGPCPSAGSSDIEALGRLSSLREATAALSTLAGGCGPVTSVTTLPAAIGGDTATWAFLVGFATAEAAMIAAQKWHGQHFGITHVIVSVRRNGGPGPRPDRPPPERKTQQASTAN